MLAADKDLALAIGTTNKKTTLANRGKQGVAIRCLEVPATLPRVTEHLDGFTVAIGPGGLATGKQQGKEDYGLDKSLHKGNLVLCKPCNC